jgi:hypothetical protein
MNIATLVSGRANWLPLFHKLNIYFVSISLGFFIPGSLGYPDIGVATYWKSRALCF